MSYQMKARATRASRHDWCTPTKVATAVPSDRPDHSVRLYLREIRSVNLPSREGEGGRWAVIAGLSESPLTFQSLVIWRDELNEGKIFLRDIIDLRQPMPVRARK
jgi:RNA polymerase primary sigma factor